MAPGKYQEQIVKKYLGRFGNPECYLLQTSDENGGGLTKGKSVGKRLNNKKYPIYDVLDANLQYSLGVHYTPNGNFADNNIRVGKMIQRKTGFEGAKPYRNAMVADFDRKDSKDYKDKENNEYLRYLLENYIDVEGLPTPDYIQESVGGYHFIWIIGDDERKRISKFMSDKNVSNAMFFIQTTAYGGTTISSGRGKIDTITGIDVGRQRFLTSSSIRLPYSAHWKTGSPIKVRLFQVYRKKLILSLREVNKPDDIIIKDENNELTYDYLKTRSNKYDEVTKSNKVLKSIIIKNSGFDEKILQEVDKIPIPEIIEKLNGMTMTYGGRQYSFKYNSSNKGITIIYDDGEIHETSGYKYREEGNMLWEFNGNKTIHERPQGKPSKFLYYFFSRNRKAVDEFLFKEFKLKLIIGTDSELGVLWHLTVGDNDIMCLPTKIILKKIVVTGSGNSVPKIIDLFQQPFIIIGKGKTSFSSGQGETEDEEQVFIAKKYNGDEKILLKCYPTKRLWNQDNIGKGLFFYGDDNDLGLFYDAIFNDKTIPEYEIAARNGYFDGYYTFGGKVFPMEEHDPIFNVCKSKGFSFKINKGKEVSLSEYMKLGSKVWDEKIFVPTFLQAIALSGTNIWDRIEGFNQFPGLLLTGYTGSGKTVLHETIALAMGYAKKTRTLSISRTSPQPLKQAGIDGSILHLEEFTDPIKIASEDILRDILNRSMSSRGTPGKNIIRQYRATPFVDGESMPQSESVANRFVIIPVDKTYWKGNTNSIHGIQQHSIMTSLYPKRYELGKDPNKIYEVNNKWVNKLTKDGINPRAANVRATMFVINELFDINYSTLRLLKYVKALMKDVGVDQGDAKRVTPFMRLRIFLTEAVMERKISIAEQVYTTHANISFIFQKEFITKNVSTVSKIINEINTLTMDRYIKEGKDLKDFKPMVFTSPMLIMNINDVNVSPTDLALGDLKDRYLRNLPKGIYSYYDGYRDTATIKDF